MSRLRSGLTTGACATAAAKAAVLAWRGDLVMSTLTVANPAGTILTVPVESAEADSSGGRAIVVKDAGDDPDITNGVRIIADVRINHGNPEIVFAAGEGIGRFTLPGLQLPIGEAAINPVPRRMIIDAIKHLLPEKGGATVTISIPGGEELAKRTLNPMLGIAGGLSVIGTTGVVEPMSEEAFKQSLRPQISVAMAQGFSQLVFVPGKIGQDFAIEKYGLPRTAVVQTSNFVGFMLESAVELGIREVLLFGHLGKMVKVAAGVFHTHNRMADARMETLAAYAALQGAPQEAVRLIMDSVTTDAVVPLFKQYGIESAFEMIAARAGERAKRFVFGELEIGTAIVSMKGALLGCDAEGRRIGGELGWNIS